MATIMDKKGNVKKPTTITNCKLRDLRNFFMAYPSTKHVLINGLSDIHIDFDEDGNILLKNIVEPPAAKEVREELLKEAKLDPNAGEVNPETLSKPSDYFVAATSARKDAILNKNTGYDFRRHCLDAAERRKIYDHTIPLKLGTCLDTAKLDYLNDSDLFNPSKEVKKSSINVRVLEFIKAVRALCKMYNLSIDDAAAGFVTIKNYRRAIKKALKNRKREKRFAQLKPHVANEFETINVRRTLFCYKDRADMEVVDLNINNAITNIGWSYARDGWKIFDHVYDMDTDLLTVTLIRRKTKHERN